VSPDKQCLGIVSSLARSSPPFLWVQVYAASALPHTPLSRYIESRVRQRLAKLEDDAAASTLSIRLISNVEVSNRLDLACG